MAEYAVPSRNRASSSRPMQVVMNNLQININGRLALAIFVLMASTGNSRSADRSGKNRIFKAHKILKKKIK